jgi:hypothetical protein
MPLFSKWEELARYAVGNTVHGPTQVANNDKNKKAVQASVRGAWCNRHGIWLGCSTRFTVDSRVPAENWHIPEQCIRDHDKHDWLNETPSKCLLHFNALFTRITVS